MITLQNIIDLTTIETTLLVYSNKDCFDENLLAKIYNNSVMYLDSRNDKLLECKVTEIFADDNGVLKIYIKL